MIQISILYSWSEMYVNHRRVRQMSEYVTLNKENSLPIQSLSTLKSESKDGNNTLSPAI